ncbi:tumor necrosis factor receptor superfamily member 1B isoform X1 [Solea solea]|uniref:tumor necrosis factor receptor superfamily member 1B isoform X1 n=1 Tax=Solea solea TaxID=90069 RepID=UPI00272B91E0|nr:tumor necrosis factor receptor superfamily member 1B isoform X1 [Solea solea]
MKNILVLLALLSVRTSKVCSQPYEADLDGKCLNPTREYRVDDSNLCCKKCPPGQRLIQECSQNTDSVCEPCEQDQYMESWNYAQNCFSCVKCKTKKGLLYGKVCSSTTRSSCICQSGMYCDMGFDDPYCTACQKYSPCRAGYGVSVSGTANSNVKCTRCPDGTFSDTNSYTDPCRPHTKCYGKAVVRNGSATSDTVCENTAAVISKLPPSKTTGHHLDTVLISTASSIKSKDTTMSDSTLSAWPSVSEEVSNHTTKSLPSPTESGINLVAVIAGIVGSVLLLFFITVLLVFLCKPAWKKDVARFHHKLDANGNCESDDKQISQNLGETRLTSFTVGSTEQQCLLENVATCSDYNHSIETLTRTDDCSSQEEIGSLQSTAAFNNSHCALSRPMTLISNAEPVTPQPSVPSQSLAQSSSQPTSPQIISPVTTSPHVNVNITFHIANGSCGTPAVVPTKLTEPDCNLPFGEEEESFSIPQQEDGKQSLMSVQDSTVCEESPA